MVVRRSALQRSGDKNVSQTPFKPICEDMDSDFSVTKNLNPYPAQQGDRGFKGAALNDFWLLFFTEKNASPAGVQADTLW